jgi:hypothetical protein
LHCAITDLDLSCSCFNQAKIELSKYVAYPNEEVGYIPEEFRHLFLPQRITVVDDNDWNNQLLIFPTLTRRSGSGWRRNKDSIDYYFVFNLSVKHIRVYLKIPSWYKKLFWKSRVFGPYSKVKHKLLKPKLVHKSWTLPPTFELPIGLTDLKVIPKIDLNPGQYSYYDYIAYKTFQNLRFWKDERSAEDRRCPPPPPPLPIPPLRSIGKIQKPFPRPISAREKSSPKVSDHG